MLTTHYNYQETLAASAKANWRIEDIIGTDKRLDFSKPFMPESLARVESLNFLSKEEKILLNQIRGSGYLYTFGVVEEFILPFVLDHVRPHLNEDDYRTRALLQFASEEAKHIHLFKKFAEEFKAGFVTYCETIGPAEAIGAAVLSHSPLGVAKTMRSFGPQLAPETFVVKVHTVIAGPPPTGTLRIVLSITNPSHAPPGEKKGMSAPRVCGIGRAVTSSMDRKNSSVPCGPLPT